jgi:RNA polymerase sigma factor (sigma-70 family)
MPPTEQARWFCEHVQPHEPALRAYLSKRFPTGCDHDDLVQETYARVLRLKEPGRLAYPKAFLFTTARNAAIDLFRRRRGVRLEPVEVCEETAALDEAPGLVESLDRQQQLEALIEALAGLPERCREVMMLRHLDGFALKEIAAHLDLSMSTVKEHLTKGLRACARHFEDRGFVPPPEGAP